jgi:GTP cyclohydrolase I
MPQLSNWKDEDLSAELLFRVTGLDPDSEHGSSTPMRFVAMLEELTMHKHDSHTHLKLTTFASQSDEMIIVKKIPFVSVCNHHVIPFIGVAHVGYVPAGKILGLSKFKRIVDFWAKRLQVQEELTTDIADHIEQVLNPEGVIVTMEAEHMCMTIRGVQTPGTTTITTVARGVFADHDKTAKAEFFQAILR